MPEGWDPQAQLDALLRGETGPEVDRRKVRAKKPVGPILPVLLPFIRMERCTVCGYHWREGEGPSSPYDDALAEALCPSCGFHFGHHDRRLNLGEQQWRADWVRDGSPWRATDRPPPEGWDPALQLEQLLYR